jgi:hypothetical protein
MLDLKNSLRMLAPRQTRYCVWIRDREEQNARLIQVWIDPDMAAFEPRAGTAEIAPGLAKCGSPESDGEPRGPEAAQMEEENNEVALYEISFKGRRIKLKQRRIAPPVALTFFSHSFRLIPCFTSSNGVPART